MSFYARKKRNPLRGAARGFKTTTVKYSASPAGRSKLQAARHGTGAIARGKRRAANYMANAQTAGFLGIETKFYDTALSASAIANAAAMTGGEYDPSATSMITTPAQGDSEQNRDGKRICIKNVQIKGCINKAALEDAVNPPGGDKVFLALVLDTQSNGAQCNSEDIFKNLSATTLMCVEPLRNLLYATRFQVLKSEMFDLDSIASSAEADNLHSTAGMIKTFEWFLPLNNLVVNFNAGTTADIANVIDNSLHVIAFSVLGTATLSYNARIRFQG